MEVPMVGSHTSGRSLAICAMVLGLAVIASPARAQTGQLKGKVTDAQNKPVEGAVVIIQHTDSQTKYTLKTKRGGDYVQIGIPPGNYTVSAEKDGLKQSFPTRVGLDMVELNFELKPGSNTAGMSKEEAAKVAARNDALRAAFAEGATLSNAGKHDEAIAKFNEVLAQVPKCTECYVNIGSNYAQKKDYAQAETALKKALEIDANSVDAYNLLATIYNDQKKFTEAQAMSAEASKRASAGGTSASADTLYNQGVIAWNANDFPKAQEFFSGAVAANPNHAESHFMLGRVYLNLGKLAEAAKEFETYVKVAPTGRNAKEAQTNFEMLKQYIK
jgi:tetratricopeptide (TPR) repeat protein